jgi:hypothetical protein
MPLSTAGCRDTLTIQVVRDGAEAAPIRPQLHHFDSQRLSFFLRHMARNQDSPCPGTSDLGIPEPLAARLRGLQGGLDTLRHPSTMLGRLRGEGGDGRRVRRWHIQGHKVDAGFPQSVDKGGGSPNGAKAWYHERCMMTPSALECLLEMWLFPMPDRFFFGEFFDEFAVRSDEAHHGFMLGGESNVPASARPDAHAIVCNIPSQRSSPSAPWSDRECQEKLPERERVWRRLGGNRPAT